MWILTNIFIKASFTLSRCTPRCVPAVYSRRTGTNRDGIRVRSYIPGSATDQARFVAVHFRCRSGGATVCPGVSRYTTVLPRESAAEPRCHCGGSRKKDGKAPVFHGSIRISIFFLELYNRNVICKVQNSIYILWQKEQQCEWERRSVMA